MWLESTRKRVRKNYPKRKAITNAKFLINDFDMRPHCRRRNSKKPCNFGFRVSYNQQFNYL